MSPDLMEAESRRYGEDCILFLPLRSGKFALLNAQHDLVKIVDTINEVLTDGPSAFRLPPRKRHIQADPILDDFNLDDLDFNI